MRNTHFWENKGSIVYKGKEYSCTDINRKVKCVREYLLQNHYSKKSMVAIGMKRGIWPVATMLALLQCGIPFLSIDMTLPEKRRRYMMEHLKIEVVFTEKQLGSCFQHMKMVTIEEFESITPLEEDYKEESYETDIAYYMYTSGSTGRPKAVEITQRGIRNFITEFPKRIQLSSCYQIASFSSMSFDIFFLEMITALLRGMRVVLATEEERRNPISMIKLIEDNKVDVIQLTPSHLQLLQYYDEKFECLTNVKRLLIGGEMFPYHLLNSLQKQTSSRIFNLYGLTETTVWSSVGELTNETEVHIGTPIEHVQFSVLDEKGEPVKEGEIGEICITGSGVGNGYKNDPELTTKHFFYPAFHKEQIYYHTGDLGKVLNGRYYCLGRKDNQVKYRGHRIELEEIDAILNQVPGIIRAVTYCDREDGNEQLFSLYESSVNMEREEILEYIRKELPDYMLPKSLYKVEHLKLSSNGKVDRRRNYEFYGSKLRSRIITNEQNRDTTELVVNIIKKCQEQQDMEITENSSLEDMAMDSLDFVKLVVDLEETFEVEFEEEMLSVNKYEIVRDLVEYVMYLNKKKV